MKTLGATLMLLLLWLGATASASGDTYTTPVDLSVEILFGGTNFDFGVQFSQIDSVSVSFTMPSGFEGFSYPPRNGYWLKEMGASLSVLNPAPFDGESIEYGGFGYTLQAVTTTVPAGEMTTINLYPAQDSSHYSYIASDFLSTGNGVIGFYTHQQSSFFDLGVDIRDSTEISLLSTAGISEASITVVGTAVSEPSGAVLISIAAVMAWCGVPRRCCRLGPTTSS